MLGGCVTSPASRIESRLLALGVSEQGAECLAGELREELDRKELNAVADFLDRIDRADRRGSAIDALMRMDDPRVVATVAAAGISCALQRAS
jgi:hypothetical protein